MPTTAAERSVRPKQIYVARRNRALSPERFRERWRAHGRLAMGLPLWRHVIRYTQGDRLDLPGRLGERLPNLDDSKDGISTLVYRSIESLVAEEQDPDMPILLADEAQVFAEMVIDTSLFAAEAVDRDDGGTAAKLSIFTRRAPGVGEVEFAAARDRHAGTVLSALWGDLVTAYRRNTRIEIPGVTGGPSSIGHFDAVTEIGFASPEDLLGAVEDDAFAEARAVLEAVSEPRAGRTIASRELLLYQGSVTI